MRKNQERKIGGNQSNSAPVCPGMSSKQSLNPSDKRALMKVDGRDRRDGLQPLCFKVGLTTNLIGAKPARSRDARLGAAGCRSLRLKAAGF